MKGVFINGHYATDIVLRRKIAETRSRDMLGSLVGERVAIINKGKVVGYMTITGKSFVERERFHDYDEAHLVEAGSKYDCTGKGKWLYWVEDAEACEPYDLPADAVRHGRSWCEWKEVIA